LIWLKGDACAQAAVQVHHKRHHETAS